MMRRSAFAWAFVGVFGLLTAVETQAQIGGQFTVNGDPRLVIYDANMNGVIPDVGDCIMEGAGFGSSFVITATQQMTTGAVPLQICQPCIGYSGVYTGTGFVSPGFAEAQITDTCVPGLGTPNVLGDFSSAGSSPSPSPDTAQGGAAGILSQPVDLEAAHIFRTDFPFDDLGSGFLCNAGNMAAVRVMDRNGLPIMLDVSPVSSGGNNFVCVPILMPRADNQQKVVINSCILSNGGMSVLMLGGMALAEIDLNGLPSCLRSTAPTSSQFGLVLLSLALLGIGTWAMSRRRAFNDALPQG